MQSCIVLYEFMPCIHDFFRSCIHALLSWFVAFMPSCNCVREFMHMQSRVVFMRFCIHAFIQSILWRLLFQRVCAQCCVAILGMDHNCGDHDGSTIMLERLCDLTGWIVIRVRLSKRMGDDSKGYDGLVRSRNRGRSRSRCIAFKRRPWFLST